MLRNYTSTFSDTELDFFKFHKRENGWGQDTLARVSSPPPSLPDRPHNMLIK